MTKKIFRFLSFRVVNNSTSFVSSNNDERPERGSSCKDFVSMNFLLRFLIAAVENGSLINLRIALKARSVAVGYSVFC